MGGAFTVEWELELLEDGTYTIIEHNPFMGDLSYEGEYTVDTDGVVTTLPFEGEPPMKGLCSLMVYVPSSRSSSSH